MHSLSVAKYLCFVQSESLCILARISKNVLSGSYIFRACVVRNENVVVGAETSYSILYFNYIILYYIILYVGNLIITQSTAFYVVNIVAGERSDPVAQLNTTFEC